MLHKIPMTVRRGFTLVELLVAAALCVLVMYVLAEAFKAGTDTLSHLKSVAGLAEQLRVAETLLRDDLGQQHLEDDQGKPVLVSDIGSSRPMPWAAPNRGFFKVVQSSAPTASTTAAYATEGTDGIDLQSARATDHWLQFTCRLGDRGVQDVFAGVAPPALNTSPASLRDYDTSSNGSQFVSRWGEVTYWLGQPDPNAKTPLEPGLPQQPLFVLYRRARVVAMPGSSPANVSVGASTFPTFQTDFPDLAVRPVPPTGSPVSWQVNTPDEITAPVSITNPFPNTRLGPATNGYPYNIPPTPFASTDTAHHGTDALLGNVVSMRIQVLDGRAVRPTPPAVPLPNSSVAQELTTTAKPLEYIDPLTLTVDWVEPAGSTPGTFATPLPAAAVATNHASVTPTRPIVWDTNPTPNPALTAPPVRKAQRPARILGVRIELRIYDPRNMVTRQVTIAREL